ncbi:hypothetical protein D918_07458 [Trichuris suis]|nr:hypothetical protein D918_07458 [Trichuris suis]
MGAKEGFKQILKARAVTQTRQPLKRSGAASVIQRSSERNDLDWAEEYDLPRSVLHQTAFEEFMSRGRSASARSVMCFSTSKLPPRVGTSTLSHSPRHTVLKALENGHVIFETFD